MILFERFEQNAQRHPNKPAFIYFNKQNWTALTYQDILDRSNRCFHGLQTCQLTPGMTAALLTPPSADFFPFALALLKFGIIPIILDPAVGLKKVREMLDESKPDIFIGNALTHILRVMFGWGRNSVKHNLTIESVNSAALTIEGVSKGRRSKIFPSSIVHRPSSAAAIIYTSGSTGLPKGAIYTQANLAAQLDLLQNTFNISQDEIDLPAFPLYALIDLLLGVTSVIPDISFPVPGKTDPAKVISAIQKFNVTNMFASPVVLDILASFALPKRHPDDVSGVERSQRAGMRFDFGAKNAPPLNAKLPSLKRIITAGAPATIDLQQRFRQLLADHTDLFGIYGATETLPIAKVESREIFTLKEKTEHGAGICLGKPIEGVTVHIIPISDEPIHEWQDSLAVKPNVVGEITVQSGATTRGYIQREDTNRLSKIYRYYEEGDLPDEAISGIASGKEQERPRNDGIEIIHRMGDVGYFDDDGRLWYCGRKSHRVITQDDVMFTEQIENIFNAHPLVFRTALVGVEGEPILWVELERGAKANHERIIEELQVLAKFHPQAARIQTFLCLKKFPTDVRHNSKIIREKLTALAAR